MAEHDDAVKESEGERREHLAYWRGRVDRGLETMDLRLAGMEDMMRVMQKTFTERLDHMHVCLERRTKILYALSGGIAVLYVVVQVGMPIVLKLLR